VIGGRPEKYTPSVLRVGSEACPRWLSAQLRSLYAPEEPFHRWNVRGLLLSRLFDAHGAGGAPTPADVRPPPKGLLLPEEMSYFNHFVQVYSDVFSDEPGLGRQHGCLSPSDIRGVSLGGAVDLLIEQPDGSMQLRQLELWGQTLPEDPLDSWQLGLALVRLHRIGGIRGSLELCHVDLNSGLMRRHDMDVGAASTVVMQELGITIRDLRSRASTPVAVPGSSCGQCSHIPDCPAWDDHRPIRSVPRPDGPSYVGPVVRLSPSSAETWLECPRKWRARHVLGLPGWPMKERARVGIRVHESLAALHEAGPCGDQQHRRHAIATLDGEVDEQLLGYLNRHAIRCPPGASPVAHEVTLAELVSVGPQAVMLTARLDSLWEHDGILDCRDYKTGPSRSDRLSDQIAPQIQALVAAPLAKARGLRLQLRYEQLAEGDDDDPEIWEPDQDDLVGARNRVSAIADEIASSDFAGVADPVECRSCPYWRACPDSAADEVEADLIISVVDPQEGDPW
jgi:hypothetical protein